ncbi:UDP-N-acetylglucosamine 2-epimerase (hydrolyzing) [bacterium]|nr:UDP-N-acetylglucosamine 2-epimerase (hydrolyzing) [bacterium]
MRRNIAAVTVARSDYGLYIPIFDEIIKHPDLDLQVIAAAAHLSPRFGSTIDQIRADGYPIAATIEMTQELDDPHSVNIGTATSIPLFSKAYQDLNPDILLLLGDRYEMHAAGLASVPHLIPIAHIHGGEETTGAIDNVFRHSLTKLSHLHFASNQEHADRIIQMGEEPSRVFVSGAPGLDRILNSNPPTLEELQSHLPKKFTPPYIIATFHPVTTEPSEAKIQSQNFLRALQSQTLPVLLTMPNADTGGLAVRQAIKEIEPHFPHLIAVENLGARLYLTAMKNARYMAGNSSSGIIEAASFGLPVVNIGNRQQGRAQSGNVINCGTAQFEIEQALQKAFDTNKFTGMNIYGDGHAAQRIVKTLASIELSPDYIKKSFYSQAIMRGEQDV